MNYIKTPLDVRLSMGRSGGEHVTPTLRISDRVSGLVITDIEISAADFSDLLAGSQVISMAEMPSVDLYERNIGKRMEIMRVPVEEWPDGWTARDPGSSDGRGYIRAESNEMMAFATDMLSRHEYQTASWTHHNYGWSLTLRRWVETTEEERIERANPHFRGL